MTRFIREWRAYGLATALLNLRFNAAYRLGGFISAKR